MNKNEILIAVVIGLGAYLYVNSNKAPPPPKYVDPEIIPEEAKRKFEIDRSLCDEKCNIAYIPKKGIKKEYNDI